MLLRRGHPRSSNNPVPTQSPINTISNATSPQRSLNLRALAALTFFCVAGGAYGLEDAVGAAGPLVVLLGILILPWLWSFPTALMTAELSTAMPEDGGYVVWVEKAFGRFWGFQEGWLSWLCSFADNALYPVMFVDYLAYLRGDMTPIRALAHRRRANHRGHLAQHSRHASGRRKLGPIHTAGARTVRGHGRSRRAASRSSEMAPT